MRKLTAPAGNTQICRLARSVETQMTVTESATKNRVGTRKKSTETKRMEKEVVQDDNGKRPNKRETATRLASSPSVLVLPSPYE